MSKIAQAIALLQVARELIEEKYATADGDGDKQDLLDVAADLGPILYTLESYMP